MPRRAREKCEHSIYHIMVRGNNKQDIFLDEQDKIQYLRRLKRYKERYKVEIYAYCLMTNHIHLLIYDNGQDISKVIQGLNLSYVIYFNKKYGRCGHLFQDRFNSIMVKRDSYFIEVSKYIHLNPVKANMVGASADYKWSSSSVYLGCQDPYNIVDNKRILAYFSSDYKESISLYTAYLLDQEVEEEAATTIELGFVGIRKRDSVREIDRDQIIQTLTEHFNVHRLNIIKRNNRIYGNQRDISIYVMALSGKMAYKELAKIFHVKPPAIGESIKRVINLMIENISIEEEVNCLLREIA
ncbi:MAG: transposase IS200-family protein [Clostridia bacterium]|jgi:REP element-mobilizing transposase RayT|nr:transposase IS200-family protein [Clostridia bacterium]